MAEFKDFITWFKPKFWHTDIITSSDSKVLFNYKRFWLLSTFLRVSISVVPLIIFLIINLGFSRTALRNENYLRTVRLTSNARRTIAYFFEERLDALKFIIRENEFQRLNEPDKLSSILQHLKMGFGGFVDVGIIDNSGMQVNYAGPFDLAGRNYRDQDWFRKCFETGVYISDVFLGYRKLPHLIAAVKGPTRDGSDYILRATLDISRITQIVSSMDLSEKSEAFLCNQKGLLQTPSRYYGDVFKKISLPIPKYSPHSEVIETTDRENNSVFIGYAYIEKSPFILMLVKRNQELMKGWYSLRKEMIWLFVGCTMVALIAALSMSTFMVNKIYLADQNRLRAMDRLESTSRLASIGRLAAGIAHEINNPLAVINENAGLIKDLFALKKEYSDDPQLMELIDAVLESVERAGDITKELLGFARTFEPKIQPLQLNKVINEVVSFYRKEALYRNININIDIPEDIPVIHSDLGNLQQIFLNLINNAFQALDSGGRLDISVTRQGERYVVTSISDNGCGIPEAEQKKIFEPFYSTKGPTGGTGLGLYISFGLVQKLKGDISVKSKTGEGTTFTVRLPVTLEGVAPK
jgi:signal transduction histidine kinase